MLGLPRKATQSLRIAITAPALGAALFVGMTNLRRAVGQRPRRRATASLQAAATTATATSATAKVVARAGPSRPLSVPRQGIYLGVYSPAVAGPSRPVDFSRYNLRILHRFQAWWGTDRFLGRAWLDAVARHGAVPMVTWEPWGSTVQRDPQEGVVREIADGGYDLYVHRWARMRAATASR